MHTWRVCAFALFMLMASLAHAAESPQSVPVGAFTLANVPANFVHKKSLLGFTPTPATFADVAQVMCWTWQYSTDGGGSWLNWHGGCVTGGPHYDQNGNLIATYAGVSQTELPRGNVRVRMIGTLTSAAPIEITYSILDMGD